MQSLAIPLAHVWITLAANFHRALRLNAGAFACRLTDRDQQEADGSNHHDCES